jgi:porphobilinogen deaminase
VVASVEVNKVVRDFETAMGGTSRASSDGRGYCDYGDHALRSGLRDVPPRIPERLQLSLSAVVLSADGVRRLTASEVGSSSEAESLGVRVADVLLAQGAAALIASSRNG